MKRREWHRIWKTPPRPRSPEERKRAASVRTREAKPARPEPRTVLSDRVLLRRVFSESRPQRGWLGLCLLLFLLATPLALLAPIPLKIAVDSVIGSQPTPGLLEDLVPDWFTSSEMRLLFTVALLQIAIVLVTQLQEAGSYVASMYTGEKITLGFRARLFAHLQRLSLGYHDSRGTSDAVYRVQYDAPSLQYILVNGLIPLVSAIVTLVMMVFVMFKIDALLSAVAIAITPFLYMLFRDFRLRMRSRYGHVKGLESDAMGVVQEVLSSLRVVKSFGREESEESRFMETSGAGLRARVKLTLSESIYGIFVNLATALGTATVLFIGVRGVQSGRLQLGELLVVLAYLARLYEPVKTISKTFAGLQDSMASADRAFTVLDHSHDVPEHPEPVALERARGLIELRDIDFSYDGKEMVLKGLSVKMEPGARIGILGPTGAGKSTLINLLTRFYDPTGGQVLLDGRDMRLYRLEDLRNQFGIVLQDPVLFSSSIGENIAYADPDAEREAIEAAARAADAHRFITELPEGYDTLVGERGMRLSGGQRQRIALARAFLKDAPILILDEPTSSVDLATEASIMAAMDRLMEGRTTIMIAHRLDTLEHCDVLIELEGGSALIVERTRLQDIRTDVAGRRQHAGAGAQSD